MGDSDESDRVPAPRLPRWQSWPIAAAPTPRPGRHRLPVHRARWIAGAVATVSVLFAGVVASQPAVAADGPCTLNAITCENNETGTSPAVWDDIWGAGDWEMQGFATDASVNVA